MKHVGVPARQELGLVARERVRVTAAAHGARALGGQARRVDDVRILQSTERTHERVSLAFHVKATGTVARFACNPELADGRACALTQGNTWLAARRMARDAVRAPANVVLRCVGWLEESVASIDEAPFVTREDDRKHVKIAIGVLGPVTLHVVRAGRDGDGRRAALGHRAVIRA